MSNFNREEYIALREAGKVEVNGVILRLHMGSLVGPNDLRLGDTGFFIPEHTEWDIVYKAAGYRTYDFAKPQDWFDDYMTKHNGRAPVGVWWYPPKSDPVNGRFWLGGRFLSVEEAVGRLAQVVKGQLIKEGRLIERSA